MNSNFCYVKRIFDETGTTNSKKYQNVLKRELIELKKIKEGNFEITWYDNFAYVKEKGKTYNFSKEIFDHFLRDE